MNNSNKLLTPEEIENILKIVDDEITLLEYTFFSNKRDIDRMLLNKIDVDSLDKKYLSPGQIESDTVSMPISNAIEENVGINNGLDAEAMLSKMHDLAIANVTFNLFDRNCSESVAQVLEAGIQQQHLKSIVAERTLFGMNTPQMVYNSALKAQQGIINNEQTNIWHRLRVFNPAVPIKKAIKSLIVFGDAHRIFIPIGLMILPVLLISLVLVKTIAYPFNMLGAFMVKESHVNIIEHKDIDVDTDQSELNIQLKKQELDQELKDIIQPKIKDINVVDPLAAILEFAVDLQDKDAIPVFSNKSVDKLKKYLHKHSETPEDLVNKIQKLNLDLPRELNYKDLSDLVDALQLLAAQRVTDSVATLHDTIKNRKTTETTQFAGDTIKTKDSISSEDPANKTTKKPDQS